MTQPDTPVICPTCNTDKWVYWNKITESGKCVHKHLIDTDPDTGKLYNSATFGPE